MLISVKKVTCRAVSAALISSLLFSPASYYSAHASSQNLYTTSTIQMICDQKTVGANGKIAYHILFHHVENKNNIHTWLKVKVPEGLEFDTEDIQGAIWEESTRTLKWNVTGKGEGADVLHFNLKVKGNVSDGAAFDLYAFLEADGKIEFETPKVKIVKGTQIDQPFFTGYPDGKFHPTASLTRAEAAAVVSRIKDLTEEATDHPYKDVSKEHWAYHDINKVTKAGYMKGFGDGAFRPDEPISRAEFVALVLRVRGVQEIPIEAFDDIKGHWAKYMVGTAKALKWIDGKGNNRFWADSNVQRQEAAKLLDIALFRGPLKDGDIAVTQHFPDVAPNHWSFSWIEEASKVAHEADQTGKGERLIRYLPDQTESFE